MRLACFLLVCIVCNAFSQARFIGPPKAERGSKVYLFGKFIELDSAPKQPCWVGVSADSRYKLYVNGTWIAAGPVHGTLAHWYVDSVNIGPWLKAGRNKVSATVWHYDTEQAPLSVSGLQAGFYLQPLAGAPAVLATDTSWFEYPVGGFVIGETATIHAGVPGYYAAPPAEAGGRLVSAWHKPAYLTKLTEVERPVEERYETNPLRFSYNYGRALEPADIKLPIIEPFQNAARVKLKVYKLLDGVWKPVPSRFPLRTVGALAVYLIDAGAYQTAYPVFYPRTSVGQVNIGYAEALYEKDGRSKGNRNVVEGKTFIGIKDKFQVGLAWPGEALGPLAWRAFRYLHLELRPYKATDTITIDSLGWRPTYHPQQLKATFSMPKAPWLAEVLQTSFRTAQACAHDTYMDCPYYEQLQYIGDTRLQALNSYYNTGERRLARQALRQFAASLTAEGLSECRAPAQARLLIPPFSLHFICMVEEYAMHVPDSATVRELLPAIRHVLSFFKSYERADGTLKPLPWWNFTDWVKAQNWHDGINRADSAGYSAVVDLQYLLAQQAAARLEGYQGRACDKDALEQAAKKLSTAITTLYYRPEDTLFADSRYVRGTRIHSQHTQALAVLAGLAGQGGVAPAKTIVAKTLAAPPSMALCSVYFSYYLHRAMEAAGLSASYLDQLQPWRAMLANGLTTWAEEPEPSRSDCHAWGSHPAVEVYRQVAGISAAGWGFGKVRVRPAYGLTRDFEAAMPHPKGVIQVSVKKGKLSVSLPEGVALVEN